MPADQFKYWVDVFAAASSVFTAFVAIVSIGIAFYSLREAKRQRESSYQPDLFLAFPTTMESRVTNFKHGYREVECVVFDDDLKATETWGIWHSIENIGLGSAKNVRIRWDFDFQKAYAAIQKTVKKPFVVKVDEMDLVLLDSDGYSLISTSYKYSEPLTKYDFVLPRKEEKFTKSPSIPQEIHEVFVIMFLTRLDVFNRAKLDNLYSEDYEDFPPLTAHLTYSDIGGKSYSKKFLIKISSSIWAFQEDEIDLKKIKKLDIKLHVETEKIEE